MRVRVLLIYCEEELVCEILCVGDDEERVLGVVVFAQCEGHYFE